MGLKIVNKGLFLTRILLMIIAIIVIILIISVITSKPKFRYDPDFNGTLDIYDAATYKRDMNAKLSATDDHFEKGVIYLSLARIERNDKMYERSCKEFKRTKTKTAEEQAILYDRLAEINCRGERSRWLTLAEESRLLHKEISHALLNYSKQSLNNVSG